MSTFPDIQIIILNLTHLVPKRNGEKWVETKIEVYILSRYVEKLLAIPCI